MAELEFESCGVCGQPRLRTACHIIKLTAEERQFFRDAGEQPASEYVYCRPCWRTLSHPISGPNLGKGLMQARLRQLGVANAEEFASGFHKKLVARIAENIEKKKNQPS